MHFRFATTKQRTSAKNEGTFVLLMMMILAIMLEYCYQVDGNETGSIYVAAVELIPPDEIRILLKSTTMSNRSNHTTTNNNSNNQTNNAGNTRGSSRIYGGIPSTKPYPFFAVGNGCGFSLIHEDILLTAAHCRLKYLDPVFVGITNLKSSNQAIRRGIIRQRPHEKYEGADYDIKLIKIGNPIRTLSTINYTRSSSTPTTGSSMTIIGFGLTANGTTDQLMQVQLNVYTDATCQSIYNLPMTLMFCAGNMETGGKDACTGDSGGPAISTTDNVIVGLISWGIGCGQKQYPGVYTRVGAFSNWIKTGICQLSSRPPLDCPVSKPILNGVPVQVRIQNDLFPNEINWVILTDDNKYMAWQTIWGLPNQVSNQTFQLPIGNYRMKIVDSGGNGNCCSHGNGTISILFQKGSNSWKLLTNTSFGSSRTTISFQIPS